MPIATTIVVGLLAVANQRAAHDRDDLGRLGEPTGINGPFPEPDDDAQHQSQATP